MRWVGRPDQPAWDLVSGTVRLATAWAHGGWYVVQGRSGQTRPPTLAAAQAAAEAELWICAAERLADP